jgi:hypothetical protein
MPLYGRFLFFLFTKKKVKILPHNYEKYYTQVFAYNRSNTSAATIL